MAGEAVKLSVDLLYLCMFLVSVWIVLLTLQCLLQHIRALQTLRRAHALQSRHFRLLQRLHAVQPFGKYCILCVIYPFAVAMIQLPLQYITPGCNATSTGSLYCNGGSRTPSHFH